MRQCVLCMPQLSDNTFVLFLTHARQLLSAVVIGAGALVRDRAEDDVLEDFHETDTEKTNAAGGWIIFVGVLAAILEITAIIIRCLNIGAINEYFKIFLIVVCKWCC